MVFTIFCGFHIGLIYDDFLTPLTFIQDWTGSMANLVLKTRLHTLINTHQWTRKPLCLSQKFLTLSKLYFNYNNKNKFYKILTKT